MLGLNTLAKRFFGSENDRKLKKLQRVVEEINALEPTMEAMDDDGLRGQTAKFKERFSQGETLDDLLPEAFAAVREAARRSIGLRHFDVQLIGGMILHQGKIAEMKTGEGKTLVATLPVYLNALAGEGVHVVTVNDYLAKRDAEWMGQVYQFLGLTVGVVAPGMDDAQRRNAYGSDVTYATNNELGFDYLRDNGKYRLVDMVQRKHRYAIVDEVDSILIDEARTPLIISGPTQDQSELYVTLDKVIQTISDEHFELDEKQRTVILTEEGTEFVEEAVRELGLLKGEGTLYDPESVSLVHHVNQALRAHKLFTRDKDYIVRNNAVVIIDEFTGRMMAGRRYSDGLHQALEAKEKVAIQPENVTLASVTFQNYFRLYDKLAGMTGTAMTEASEFGEIYGLEVVEVPPNLPVVREDEDDLVFRTAAEKYDAIVLAIADAHRRGQPVLVGTASIEKSELISTLLKDKRHLCLAAGRSLRRFVTTELKASAKSGEPIKLGELTAADAATLEKKLADAKSVEKLIEFVAEKFEISAHIAKTGSTGNDDGGDKELSGHPLFVKESIENAQTVLALAAAEGVPHEVLNARYHEREAYIVAQAGQPGAVMIATNMAGRGTDIKLGGNAELLTEEAVAKAAERIEQETAKAIAAIEKEAEETKSQTQRGGGGADEKAAAITNLEAETAANIAAQRARSQEKLAKETEEITARIEAEVVANQKKVLEAGGLWVISSERHESRRIDNQLRGRSGRQGDPGRSTFYLSLQDDLMRIFGSDKMDAMLRRLGLEEGEAIVHPWVNKAIERAQGKVEARNFEIRKNVLKFDDVMNNQRRAIFEQRCEIMEVDDVSETIRDMRHGVIDDLVSQHIPERAYAEQWEVDKLEQVVALHFGERLPVKAWSEEEGADDETIREKLYEETDKIAAKRTTDFGAELMRLIEKDILLKTIDFRWREHLSTLDHLRSVINFRGYGQRDPLNEYKSEAFTLFETLLARLRSDVVAQLMNIQLARSEPRTDPEDMAINAAADGALAMGKPALNPAPLEELAPADGGESAHDDVRNDPRAAQRIGAESSGAVGSGSAGSGSSGAGSKGSGSSGKGAPKLKRRARARR